MPPTYVGLCLSRKAAVSGRVAVAALASFPVAFEESERDERVEEVVNPARMEAERGADRLGRHRVVTEHCEEFELDRRQERLRWPEPHAHLHDVRGVKLRLRHRFLRH